MSQTSDHSQGGNADAPDPIDEEAAAIDPRDPDAREEVRELIAEANDGKSMAEALSDAAESVMCDVEFRFQPTTEHGDVRTMAVVGDFNSWSEAAHPMAPDATGAFVVVVPLMREHRYRYRFLIDGDRWENDPAADDYVANDFGGDDCVRAT